jgi:ATP-binding cassette subfamily B protein
MIKLIKNNLQGYKLFTILGPIFKLLEAIVELILPLIVASIIDKGIKGGDGSYVISCGILMLVLYVVSFGFSLVCQYFAAKSSFGFGSNLRRRFFRHINKLPLWGADKVSTSALITRINYDVSNIQTALNRFLRLLTRSPFILVGSIIMAFSINMQLSLIFVIASLLVGLALTILMLLSSKRLGIINPMHEKVTTKTRENLGGTRVVRAFDMQNDEIRKFEKLSVSLKKESIILSVLTALSHPFAYLIMQGGMIAVVYFGAAKVSSGVLSQGEIIALINYFLQILNAITLIAMLAVMFARAAASGRRINEVLSLPVEENEGKTEFAANDESIVFQDVSLRYGENSGPTLQQVSFSFKKGDTLGIIGTTGSGKSSLVALLPRLYDYEGKITLFGNELSEYDKSFLRDKIALAQQKPVLFSGTVRDNMLVGRENATEEEIRFALQQAECDFIKTPSAIVARGGSNFSGGQKQRIALARAFLKNSEILIIDDAMNALDYETEAKIKKNLSKNKDITKIIVSQRTQSLMGADLILVLSQGKIVGMGRHKELLASCPLYKEISKAQGGVV